MADKSNNDVNDAAVQAALHHLADIEILAEDILVDKQMLISLDKRSNGCREALRSIRNTDKSNQSWMCFGETFVELPNYSIKTLLEKEQERTQAETERMRTNLKPKLTQLYQMEGKQPREGFDLKPLSRDELSAVTQTRN